MRIDTPASNGSRRPTLLEALKAPKSRAYTHREATGHASVGGEHVRTRCTARNKCRPPRRATPQLVTGPLLCTVSMLLLEELVLQQCSIAAMPCLVAATWGNAIFVAGVASCSLWRLAVAVRPLVFNGGGARCSRFHVVRGAR